MKSLTKAEIIRLLTRDKMKYVWASWGNRIEEQFPGESINSFRTRHVRGYGCAVTFSCARITWSAVDATMTAGLKYMEPTFTRH